MRAKKTARIKHGNGLNRSKSLTGAWLNIGAPQEKADILYWTGLTMPDPLVHLRMAGAQYVVVSILDLELARHVLTPRHVYTPDMLDIPQKLKGTLAGWALGLLRKLDLKTVVVPPDLPVRIADQLRRARIRLIAAESAVSAERAVKARSEAAKLRSAQRAAVCAMRAAVAMIKKSDIHAAGYLVWKGSPLTAEILRAAIRNVLMEHNCVGLRTIVACGTQACMPHNEGAGLLRANSAIVLDIFPRHIGHGYWGDLTRTVVRGRAGAKLKKMYLAVKAAQRAAIAAIRPGVSAKSVHQTVCALFQKRGFPTGLLNGKAQGFIHSTGHGIGLDVHEAPSLGNRPGRLRAGHVVTVEPGLYYFDTGGVRIEDVVVVTRRGCRKLVNCEHVFEI